MRVSMPSQLAQGKVPVNVAGKFADTGAAAAWAAIIHINAMLKNLITIGSRETVLGELLHPMTVDQKKDQTPCIDNYYHLRLILI